MPLSALRRLRFYKLSPGGNSTILILDPVHPLERAPLARQLMDCAHLQAEQVGYLDLAADPVRLDMMGGEFCGNACRSSVLVMACEGVGLAARGETLFGRLSVSGVDRVLDVRLEDGDCWVDMPLPEGAACGHLATVCRELEPGVTLVRLPGISHVLLDERLHTFPDDFEDAARSLRRRFGLDDDAVGCIWYALTDGISIRPVVWVRSTDSTWYETGCGSGTLALALHLGTRQNFPFSVRVRQPSGSTIGVHMDMTDGALQAWIFGPVGVIARGETWLPNA